MIQFKHLGDFNNLENFLSGATKMDLVSLLSPYGQQGVGALSQATPIRTGETAASWSYEIKVSPNSINIIWANSKMAGNVPLVVLIQYGHGTGTGGYVQGIDFINPALQPIFDQILENVWKEIIKL